MTKPFSNLLAKDATFDFNDNYTNAFCRLKKALILTSIMQSPNWNLLFQIMCDTNDYVIGIILRQRRDNKPYTNYYANHTLDETHINYGTPEKELLVVVFTFNKFQSYSIGFKLIIYTNHVVLKYLLNKKDTKPRLI